jgi:hypothetical protein
MPVGASCWGAHQLDNRSMSALGQKQTFAPQKAHARFTPESGHVRCTSLHLLWAISGHLVSALL